MSMLSCFSLHGVQRAQRIIISLLFMDSLHALNKSNGDKTQKVSTLFHLYGIF